MSSFDAEEVDGNGEEETNTTKQYKLRLEDTGELYRENQQD